MPGLQLPWNDELLAELLHCIIIKGAHLNSKASNCEAVNTMFFDQDVLRHYKAAHFKDAKDFRKIKEKAKSTIEKIKAERGSGRMNTSGLSRDLSALYKNAEQIIAEKEQAKEIIESKASQKASKKRKLDDNVEAVLKPPMEGFGARKGLNGEITGGKNGNNKSGTSTVEDRIWKFLENDGKADDETEIAMLEWVEQQGKTEEKLVKEAKIDYQDATVLAKIEMEILISIYCSTGSKFDAVLFKEALEKEDMSSLGTRRVFCTLQKWRREAMKEKMSPNLDWSSAATLTATAVTPTAIVIDGPAAATDIQQEDLSEGSETS